MGVIKDVIYQEVDQSIYSTNEANEYYWYQNLLGLNSKINSEYEDYTTHQIKTKNKILRELTKGTNIHPNVSSSMIGVSSMKNNVIIFVEI